MPKEKELAQPVKLYPSTAKTSNVWYPKPDEVLTDAASVKGKLLPILSLDAGLVRPELKDKIFHFVMNDVSVSSVSFLLESDKYTIAGEPKLKKITDLSEYKDNRKHLSDASGDKDKIDSIETRRYDEMHRLTQNETESPRSNEKATSKSLTRYFYESTLQGAKVTSSEYYTALDPLVLRMNRKYTYNGEGLISQVDTEWFGPLVYRQKLSYDRSSKGMVKVTNNGGDSWTLLLIEAPNKQKAESVYQGMKKKFTDDYFSWIWITPGGLTDLSQYQKEIAEEAYRNFLDTYVSRYSREKYSLDYDISDKEEVSSLTYHNKYQGEQVKEEYTYKQISAGEIEITKTNGNSQQIYIAKQDGEQIEIAWLNKGVPTSRKIYTGKSLADVIFRHLLIEKTPFHLDALKENTEEMLLVDRYDSKSSTWAKHHYELTKDGYVKTDHVILIERKSIEENVTLDPSTPIKWLQSDETPLAPDGKAMEYIASLTSPKIFGTYYLFYSAKHNLVTQIFQST